MILQLNSSSLTPFPASHAPKTSRSLAGVQYVAAKEFGLLVHAALQDSFCEHTQIIVIICSVHSQEMSCRNLNVSGFTKPSPRLSEPLGVCFSPNPWQSHLFARLQGFQSPHLQMCCGHRRCLRLGWHPSFTQSFTDLKATPVFCTCSCCSLLVLCLDCVNPLPTWTKLFASPAITRRFLLFPFWCFPCL